MKQGSATCIISKKPLAEIRENIMRTKTSMGVVALAGAAVISIAVLAPQAQAAPTGNVVTAAKIALAKPPGNNKSSFFKNSHSRNFYSRYHSRPYWYGSSYCYPSCYSYSYCQPVVEPVEEVPVQVCNPCCYNTCSYGNYCVPQFASRYHHYSHYSHYSGGGSKK
jgi:hypothetical protein